MTSPQFPRRARTLVPGATLTPAQFWALAHLMRTSEPSREAARMVLVDGCTVTGAAAATNVLQPSVSRLVGRFKRAHALVASAYEDA